MENRDCSEELIPPEKVYVKNCISGLHNNLLGIWKGQSSTGRFIVETEFGTCFCEKIQKENTLEENQNGQS